MTEVRESITSKICQFLEIDTGTYETSFVKNILEKRIAETNCNSLESYYEFLSANNGEVKTLELFLQNSYSEFFRNPLTFSVLEKIIFPSLLAGKVKKGKELRIWSAACASGQEPYSLAMLLEEVKNSKNEPIRYRIFATDKSNIQIEQALSGHYPSFSLGQVSLNRISRWFEKEITGSENYRYCIKNELKRNIDFSVFDLLEKHINVPPSSIFGNFDLVFCANLLFYYKPANRKVIINKITESLAVNGYLIVGETERELLIQQGFTEIFYMSGIFRR